jgi:hypothetical protein
MTETPQGLDLNETITVKGVAFAGQLTIGAAKWLERQTGKTILAAAEEFAALTGKNLEVTKVALLLTALAIAAQPQRDPREVEAAVGGLTLSDMLEVLERASPFTFEPKNSRPTPPEPDPATGASLGPSSNTT